MSNPANATSDLILVLRETCNDESTFIDDRCVDEETPGPETMKIDAIAGEPLTVIVSLFGSGETGPLTLTVTQEP